MVKILNYLKHHILSLKSLTGRMFFALFLSMIVSLIPLISGLWYTEHKQQRVFENTLVKNQIQLTLDNNENSRLNKDYGHLIKELWRLELFEEVTLYAEGPCEILAKLPLSNKATICDQSSADEIFEFRDNISGITKVGYQIKKSSNIFGGSSFSGTAFILISYILIFAIIYSLSIRKLFLIPFREQTKKIAVADIARQVAHDIRSPLSALDMIISSSEKLPDEERHIVKHAVRRIHDIANNLLDKTRTDFTVTESKPILLATTIESIVSEKRIQYRTQINAMIDTDFSEDSLGIFVNANESDLKRILSNLINNSIEALKNDEGKVVLKLTLKNNFAAIEISDNGAGIPDHILKSLTSGTPISAKPDGNAIGLKSANEIIDKFNGTLEINTKLDIGTSIQIKLPLATTPEWYQHGLIIRSNDIVIIDDDKTIHQLWAQKLSQANFNGNVKNYTDFENEILTNAQYLIDYEFQSADYNGLDKIIELKIPNAILVTSHYDEENVQIKCIERNIKIIPKSAIPYLPIIHLNSVNLVLLDDDELIRLSWEHGAKNANKNIKTYGSSKDFMNDILLFSKDTPIYLDSELNEDKKGEDIALELSKLGFMNLNLCTGHSPDQFKDMTWLNSVQGKSYPT